MNPRGRGVQASALQDLEQDLAEFREERIAIMTADGVPEAVARAYAERRARELRRMHRRMLAAAAGVTR